MLRITLVEMSPPLAKIVLKLEGDLSEQYLPVLAQEWEFWSQWTDQLVLDLEDVRFIDRSGAELLWRWASERLWLQGTSEFIRELLEKHGTPDGKTLQYLLDQKPDESD